MTYYEITRPGFQLPPYSCIGPKSYQSDPTVPSTETIILPARDHQPHRWRFELVAGQTRSADLGRRARVLAALFARRPVHISEAPVFDARIYSPGNFAHFSCFHVPLIAEVARQLDLPRNAIKVILPANPPGYTIGLAKLFGLDFLCTDAPVTGRIVTFDEALTQDELRIGRRQLVENAGLPDHIAQQVQASAQTFSGKFFLSRRGPRSLENNDAVRRHLETRGYRMIYTEDLSLIDQFSLMQSAEELVAIHGAGLAPMLYLKDPQRLKSFVEITPVGWASSFFREIAHALGVYHVAVRGRLKPAYIPGIYKTTGSFMAFQNDTFSLDLDALDQALAFAKYRINVPPDLPI